MSIEPPLPARLDIGARTLIDEPSPSTCVACSGPMRPWSWGEPQDPSVRRLYLLCRCERCGTASTAGVDEPNLYETGVYATASPRARPLIEAIRNLVEDQKLRLLRRYLPPPARLLDVGAGQGRFVAAADAAGYTVRGFEPSRRGVEIAAGRGVELDQATIDGFDTQPGSFDGVTLWGVLEHLDRPDQAVERAASWLRPGGVLLFLVPNLDSLQARIGAWRWIHLDVPRHRHHFTPKGAHQLLTTGGFAVEGEHHVFIEHNLFGMWQSWLDRVTTTPSYAYNFIKRNAAANARDLAPTLLLAPLAPLAFAGELCAGLARRGGTMLLVARRR